MDTLEKIKVVTRDFDEIEVTPKDIITFPNGIFAFEEYSRYILISPLGNGKCPVWLQSVENPGLCFIMFDPFEFCQNYSVTADEGDLSAIDIKEEKDAVFYVIAVIPEDHMEATVNLKSPIIINSKNNKAVQIIAAEDYPIKFPVFSKEGKQSC